MTVRHTFVTGKLVCAPHNFDPILAGQEKKEQHPRFPQSLYGTMPPQQRQELTTHDDETSCYTRTEPKRKLRFSLASNQIFPIQHIDDMEEADVLATWYEKKDYDVIKSKIIPVIRKMMKKEDIPETDKETVRGLEYRTRQGALRRQHNKLEAITAVLEEQQRQKNFDDNNDENLRKAYRSACSHCQDEAHELALKDEGFVKTDLEESRRNPRKLRESGPARTKSGQALKSLLKHVRMRNRRQVSDNASSASKTVTKRAMEHV